MAIFNSYVKLPEGISIRHIRQTEILKRIYPVKSRMMSYVTSVRATRPPLCCLSYTDHQLSLIAPPLWLILFMFSCNTPKFSEMFPQIEETAFKHLLQDDVVSNIFIFSGA